MASNALYPKGKEIFLQAGIDMSGGTIKAALIDLTVYGIAVTGATNATPIVVTAAAHGLSNGMVVAISGVLGNTAANGAFKVANVTTNTFELTGIFTGTNVAGSGAYTSGGRAMPLGLHQFYSSVSSSVVGTPVALASKTFTNGVFKAANTTITAVTGNAVGGVILYKDTGTAGTSNLIAWLDGLTNLPVTPNGGDITLQWDTNGIFTL
jgi:hypothetical protein